MCGRDCDVWGTALFTDCCVCSPCAPQPHCSPDDDSRRDPRPEDRHDRRRQPRGRAGAAWHVGDCTMHCGRVTVYCSTGWGALWGGCYAAHTAHSWGGAVPVAHLFACGSLAGGWEVQQGGGVGCEGRLHSKHAACIDLLAELYLQASCSPSHVGGITHPHIAPAAVARLRPPKPLPLNPKPLLLLLPPVLASATCATWCSS